MLLLYNTISVLLQCVCTRVRTSYLCSSQVVEAGTSSRRGSRSSDYTGQPLLLDEYTDNLVEEAIRSGLTAVVYEEQTRETNDVAVTVEVPQISQPPDDDTVALANSLVATAFERAKESIVTSPKKTVISLSSAGKTRLSPTKRKTPKKSPGKKVKHLGVSLTDGGGYLAPPLSRMSIAWSVASTRDDESVPTSPTELDQIALGMVSSIDEYSSLLADLIIKEVLIMNSTPQQLQLAECGEGGGLSFRVQTYLHSLGEVSSYSLDPDTTGVPPFSPHYYNLRKTHLRAVATGHNKERGDPQLQAIIHWIAVSLCGRPEMIYSTFKEESLQQVCTLL